LFICASPHDFSKDVGKANVGKVNEFQCEFNDSKKYIVILNFEEMLDAFLGFSFLIYLKLKDTCFFKKKSFLSAGHVL
jgi:hypothetical protein